MSNTVIRAVALFYLFATACVTAKNELRGKKSLDQVDNESDRFLGNQNVFSAPNPTGVGQYVIQFASNKSFIESQSTFADSASTVLMTMEEFNMEVVEISSEEELEELIANENVVSIEKDQERYLLNPFPKVTAKNERRQQEGEQIPYGIDLVRALEVSDEFVEDIKVCIIDTGYDITHEDLPDGSNVGGNDNLGNSWDEDGNGHGTHVAGTIAAIGNNNVGVVGVNRSGRISLHIERLFGNNGRPIFGSTIIKLANDCVAAGSDIISMSLGGPFGMDAESQAFERIYKENNVLVVAAAGNSANTAYSYPASYDSVMSVAAIDDKSEVAFFSQENDQVDISAPGVEVLSTKTGGGYIAYSGTSMACPHVAGVAALVWSHFQEKSSEEIRNALTASAVDLGPAGRDDAYGHGLIRADRAFQLLNGDFTLSPTAAPTPERPCSDDPQDFTDSQNNGCDWYTGGLFNRCTWFASYRANSDGITAIDACCYCGGGGFIPITQTSFPTVSPTISFEPSSSPKPTSAPTSSPTPSPTVPFTLDPTATPTSSPTGCVDEEGWVNSRGDGCDTYGFFKCVFFGNWFENEGKTANDACCVCQ